MYVAKTSKGYASRIFTYKKRRAAFIKKSRKRLRNYTAKLKVWTREFRRAKAKEAQASKLMRDTNEYFQVDIRTKSNKRAIVLARYCFFKYGIDKKINGSLLVLTIGYNYPPKAYRDRKRFTQSFKKNTQNKNTYHQFKDYMQNL